ncbi:MAG: phosphoglucosamine mutase [Gammaproteobacteria bacterium]
MSRRYFGTDGVRGRVGQFPITAEFMLKLGWAAGKVLSPNGGGKVLIGKDTRVSGYMFESALQTGLAAAGTDIHLLGVLPTPGIAYLTRTLRARAGIVISASHNPYFDNGVKFFSGDGYKLPDEVELEIEDYLDRDMDTVDSDHLGRAHRVNDAQGRYIEFCKATIPSAMSLAGLVIVLDCGDGATYYTAPAVFRELGAEVITIGVEPTGLNINRDSGSTKPERLREEVLKRNAHVGIAFDGDGDRVIMVDDTGRIVDGDEVLYVIATDRKQAGFEVNGVVGTLMTNLGLEHALRAESIDLHRAKVGDRYVMEKLKGESLLLGGENSGHVICLDRNTTGDGIVSALQVLAAMIRSGRSLAELTTKVTMYPQIMINVPLPGKVDLSGNEAVQAGVRDAEARLADTGRVLLRPSGTEPVVRVMVEGEDEALVRQVCQDLADVVSANV